MTSHGRVAGVSQKGAEPFRGLSSPCKYRGRYFRGQHDIYSFFVRLSLAFSTVCYCCSCFVYAHLDCTDLIGYRGEMFRLKTRRRSCRSLYVFLLLSPPRRLITLRFGSQRRRRRLGWLANCCCVKWWRRHASRFTSLKACCGISARSPKRPQEA